MFTSSGREPSDLRVQIETSDESGEKPNVRISRGLVNSCFSLPVRLREVPLPISLTQRSLRPSRFARSATYFPSREMVAARPTPSKPARRLNLALASRLPVESAFLVPNHVRVPAIDSNTTPSDSHNGFFQRARDARALTPCPPDSAVPSALATASTDAVADEASTGSVPKGGETARRASPRG